MDQIIDAWSASSFAHFPLERIYGKELPQIRVPKDSGLGDENVQKGLTLATIILKTLKEHEKRAIPPTETRPGGGHIVVAGGVLYGRNIPSKLMGKSIKRTLLKLSPGKGLGAVADEDMVFGDIAGIYVCSRVSESDDQPESRFAVRCVGGKEPQYIFVSRFTSRMTVRWYTDKKSSCGPFVNAAWDGATANCKLDRAAGWEDDKDADLGRALMIFALIVNVPIIQKGEELLWQYDPFALKGRMVPEGY